MLIERHVGVIPREHGARGWLILVLSIVKGPLRDGAARPRARAAEDEGLRLRESRLGARRDVAGLSWLLNGWRGALSTAGTPGVLLL